MFRFRTQAAAPVVDRAPRVPSRVKEVVRKALDLDGVEMAKQAAARFRAGLGLESDNLALAGAGSGPDLNGAMQANGLFGGGGNGRAYGHGRRVTVYDDSYVPPDTKANDRDRAKAASNSGKMTPAQKKKAIESLKKRAAEHEQKLKDFKRNPTPRPGTENLPKHVQQKSIRGREQHLQKEIKAFQDTIRELERDR